MPKGRLRDAPHRVREQPLRAGGLEDCSVRAPSPTPRGSPGRSSPWFSHDFQYVAALWLGQEFFEFVKDWKSAIFGVWATPAPETLAKGGGFAPPPF